MYWDLSVVRILVGLLLLMAAGCAKGTVWVKPRTNFDDLKRITVLPFESNKPGLGYEISNRIITSLLQLGRFEVSDISLLQKGGEGTVTYCQRLYSMVLIPMP